MESRLKHYALTAGGTAALAAAGPAAADIISSSGPISIAPNTASPLFEIDGMQLRAFNSASGYDVTAGFYQWNGSDQASTGLAWQIAPWTGTEIDQFYALGLEGSLYRAYYYASSNRWSYKGYLPAGTFLLAFSLSDDADTYYGWLEYSLVQSGNSSSLVVNSWAYNDVAGQGIRAGEYTAGGGYGDSGDNAVPGIGGLAGLAIGAAGLRSRRQRPVA